MADYDSLTKNLTHIVGNLKNMIEKKNTENYLPQPQTIKKTSDMTYSDFLQKVLKNRTPVPVTAKKQPYSLQQDLELLFALSSQSTISGKTFQDIASKKRINRTPQSLKSRYHDYLHKISQKQIKKIVNFIQKNGVQGFLTFEQSEMIINQFEKTDDKKRQRPVSLEQESKKAQKKITSKAKSVPTNCKQLNEVLRLYSKMVNVSVKDLLQILDKLSGDMVLLDNYIETKDQRLMWSFDQDEILRKGGVQVEVLRKYRGNGIEIRKKYLGIN